MSDGPALYGPKKALAALDPPPPVSLLRGPPGVGKRTICEAIAARVGGQRVRIEVPEPKRRSDGSKAPAGPQGPALTVEAAVGLRESCSFRPRGGKRAVVVDLTGAGPEAANLLLRLLEEPPRGHVFLLHADGPVLSAVASRATQLWLPLLAEEDVVSVLISLGWTEMESRRAAAASGGSVARAVEFQDPEAAACRSKVQVLLRCWHARDLEGLANATSGVGPAELAALRTWAVEARAQTWRMYRAEQSSGCERDSALQDRILRLCQGNSRPRPAVRMALAPR